MLAQVILDGGMNRRLSMQTVLIYLRPSAMLALVSAQGKLIKLLMRLLNLGIFITRIVIGSMNLLALFLIDL
jgi:hypothetical protein